MRAEKGSVTLFNVTITNLAFVCAQENYIQAVVVGTEGHNCKIRTHKNQLNFTLGLMPLESVFLSERSGVPHLEQEK